MILSEDSASGHRELSLQAPWSQLTKIQLPPLHSDVLNCLGYRGRYAHAEQGTHGRQSMNSTVTVGDNLDSPAMPFSPFIVDALCHPESRGILDLKGKDEAHGFHRIRVKLRPTCPQVRRALDACRVVLPSESAEKMVSGWWNVMQWGRSYGSKSRTGPSRSTLVGESDAEVEWSSFAILVIASFLALDEEAAKSSFSSLMSPTRPMSGSRAAGKSWDAMMQTCGGTPFAAACPPWMRGRGWQWLLDQGVLDKATTHSPIEVTSPGPTMDDHMSRQVCFALEYMASPPGITALGLQGYLPTAPSSSKTLASRFAIARSIILALHLLHEEQKLNIATATEETPPGQTDLRVLLGQIAGWLQWQRYKETYELGLQGKSCLQGQPGMVLAVQCGA